MEASGEVNRSRFGDPLDWFDTLALVALAALSMWIVALLVRSAHSDGLTWTGTDGPYLGDQMQYLGWIRDSAHHVLIGNPYQLNGSTRDFLHPGLVISGLLNRLGVAAWLAYLLWKPVAVLALFAAVRAYIQRVLPRTVQRRFALVIALLFVSPAAYFFPHFGWHWSHAFFLQPDVFEMWPGLYLWGYPFTAIAVALLPATLLSYERARTRGRVGVIAPVLGLFCAWLQPWQGATVIAVLLVSEAVSWCVHRSVHIRILYVTVGATAVPLLYYSILGRADASWKLAAQANSVGSWPLQPVLLAIAPLGLLALVAYRQRPTTFQGVAVRVWPFAAVAIYELIALSGVGTFPLHALQGLSIPLAVLAVEGVSGLRVGIPGRAKVAIAVAALVALSGPAVIQQLRVANRVTDVKPRFFAVPYLIAPGERDTLNYIEESRLSGGVFARVYLGQAVPALTGRPTWVGLLSWTPEYHQRSTEADAVFDPRTTPEAALRRVESSGARFVFEDCRNSIDLTRRLEPILQVTQRFGCATVYVVR